MKSCLLNVRDCKSFGLWLSVNEMTTECFARKDEGQRKGEKEGIGEEERRENDDYYGQVTEFIWRTHVLFHDKMQMAIKYLLILQLNQSEALVVHIEVNDWLM